MQIVKRLKTFEHDYAGLKDKQQNV